jgi:hypothetical protein
MFFDGGMSHFVKNIVPHSPHAVTPPTNSLAPSLVLAESGAERWVGTRGPQPIIHLHPLTPDNPPHLPDVTSNALFCALAGFARHISASPDPQVPMTSHPTSRPLVTHWHTLLRSREEGQGVPIFSSRSSSKGLVGLVFSGSHLKVLI